MPMTPIALRPAAPRDDGRRAGPRMERTASAVVRRDQGFGIPNDTAGWIASRCLHQRAAEPQPAPTAASEAPAPPAGRIERALYSDRAGGAWTSRSQSDAVLGAAALPERRIAAPTSSRAQQRLGVVTKKTIAPAAPAGEHDVAQRAVLSDCLRTMAGWRFELSTEVGESWIVDPGFLWMYFGKASPTSATVPVSGPTTDGLVTPCAGQVCRPRAEPVRGTGICERRLMLPGPRRRRGSALAGRAVMPMRPAAGAPPFPSAEGPHAVLHAARTVLPRTRRAHGLDVPADAEAAPSRVARPGLLRPVEPCQ